MKLCNFDDVKIEKGFWKIKQDMLKNVTVHSVYNRFKDTYRFEALKCEWKPGMEYTPHVYWDSDVAKWIEGVAYLLKKEPDEELEKIVEDTIDCIIENSDGNGYFNSHFLVMDQDKRFQNRNDHELYCAGHLMEAAVAYYDATGKDRFLKAMCKYADYIEKRFKIDRDTAFTTPGHPELELALYKLYKATGEKRYFELAEFFIDNHGTEDGDKELCSFTDVKYNQDDVPVKDRKTVDGHAVRALYLLSGAVDVAKERNDETLLNTCRRLFDNIVSSRMYITGGVGSSANGEAFTVDYDLPNRTAYAETCAAIAMVFFSKRLLETDNASKYADAIEKVLYNGFLSSVSMDGKRFFYENPLEIDLSLNNVDVSVKNKSHTAITQRVEVFGCSCCPPNIVRFIPLVGELIYGLAEDTVYINQYIDSSFSKEKTEINISTEYPKNGYVKINYKGDKKSLALRIPEWCGKFSIGKNYSVKNGYAFVDVECEDEIIIDFDMPVVFVEANPRVHENAGRVAVMRGPVVYCAEGVDNGENLKCVKIINEKINLHDTEFILPGISLSAYKPDNFNSLYRKAKSEEKQFELKLIPYYAFANRGESDMLIWFLHGNIE